MGKETVKGRFVVAFASSEGPARYVFDSIEELTSTLMAWFRLGCKGETDTAWQKKRGRWVPMFPYQHGV